MINITKTKLSSSLVRQALLSRQQYSVDAIPRVSTSLLHTSSFQQKSIIEKAKDLGETVKKTGHDVNLKMGQELAHGIEEAEAIVRKTPSVKQVGDKVKQASQAAANETRNLNADVKARAKETKNIVDEETQYVSEQLQREKEGKMAQVKERAKEIKKSGEEKVAEGVDRVEDAIQDTSEKLGAKGKSFTQAEHRLEDEVEDAVQRLQHKRD